MQTNFIVIEVITQYFAFEVDQVAVDCFFEL